MEPTEDQLRSLMILLDPDNEDGYNHATYKSLHADVMLFETDLLARRDPEMLCNVNPTTKPKMVRWTMDIRSDLTFHQIVPAQFRYKCMTNNIEMYEILAKDLFEHNEIVCCFDAKRSLFVDRLHHPGRYLGRLHPWSISDDSCWIDIQWENDCITGPRTFVSNYRTASMLYPASELCFVDLPTAVDFHQWIGGLPTVLSALVFQYWEHDYAPEYILVQESEKRKMR